MLPGPSWALIGPAVMTCSTQHSRHLTFIPDKVAAAPAIGEQTYTQQ